MFLTCGVDFLVLFGHITASDLLSVGAVHHLKEPQHYFNTCNSRSSSEAHTSASHRHGASSQQWGVADWLHVLQKLNKHGNTTQPYKHLPLLSSFLQTPRGTAGMSEEAISSSSNTQGERQWLWAGPWDEQSSTAPREAIVPMKSTVSECWPSEIKPLHIQISEHWVKGSTAGNSSSEWRTLSDTQNGLEHPACTHSTVWTGEVWESRLIKACTTEELRCSPDMPRSRPAPGAPSLALQLALTWRSRTASTGGAAASAATSTLL